MILLALLRLVSTFRIPKIFDEWPLILIFSIAYISFGGILPKQKATDNASVTAIRYQRTGITLQKKMYVEQEGMLFYIPSCSVFKIKSEHLKRSLTGLDKCVANKMC